MTIIIINNTIKMIEKLLISV